MTTPRFAAVPFRSGLLAYEVQAQKLLLAHQAGDRDALEFIHHKHPRFLDESVRWLPRRLTAADIAAASFTLDDAKLSVARGYDFADWEALVEHVEAACAEGSPVALFESAVEAVVSGDEPTLRLLLKTSPELIRARPSRRTQLDPPVHRATLLHYIAANGVEGYHQSTPPNGVAIARILLEGGAEPDAPASMYGGEWTTLSLLVSSSHPAEAGLQVALADLRYIVSRK